MSAAGKKNRTVNWPEGVDFGLEIALSWLDQSRSIQLDRGERLRGFARGVCHMLNSAQMILIERRGVRPIVHWNDFEVSSQALARCMEDGGFYSRLSAIRRTRSWRPGAAELQEWVPPTHPPVRALLAVPLFRGKQPSGCLAVANRRGGCVDSYEERDRLLLALAGSVASCRLSPRG